MADARCCGDSPALSAGAEPARMWCWHGVAHGGGKHRPWQAGKSDGEMRRTCASMSWRSRWYVIDVTSSTGPSMQSMSAAT